MKLPFIAGVLFLLGAAALAAGPLDDKVKVFEEAVKASPPAKTAPGPSIFPAGRALTVEDLETVRQRGDNEMSLEGVVSQLMSTHPSDDVQKAGRDVIAELEAQQKTKAEAFEAKANAVLAEAPDAVTHAKKASDHDGILKGLQELQNPQGAAYGYDASSQLLVAQINATFQFVTQWQDYLSAFNSGNMQEAQNDLRNILNNRQIDAPTFFPRSEILAKLEEAEGGKPEAGAPPTDVDTILANVKTVDDVSDAMNRLEKIPGPNNGPAWDWSALKTLDKTRDDALAGLPVALDLKLAVNGPVFSDDISRIEAMELRIILPIYLGTDISDPPKKDEMLTAYLDRLITEANSGGDMGALQRVLAVKVALAGAAGDVPARGTQQFLAGLSQDAGGQYAPAVISYESALKEPDAFLPVKIVAERLAAIKAAHPDEFDKGLTAFMTPAPVNPFVPPGMPPWMQGRFGNPYGNQISVLPIPRVVSIPARETTPSGTGPTTNSTPVNPVPPTTTK